MIYKKDLLQVEIMMYEGKIHGRCEKENEEIGGEGGKKGERE